MKKQASHTCICIYSIEQAGRILKAQLLQLFSLSSLSSTVHFAKVSKQKISPQYGRPWRRRGTPPNVQVDVNLVQQTSTSSLAETQPKSMLNSTSNSTQINFHLSKLIKWRKEGIIFFFKIHQYYPFSVLCISQIKEHLSFESPSNTHEQEIIYSNGVFSKKILKKTLVLMPNFFHTIQERRGENSTHLLSMYTEGV